MSVRSGMNVPGIFTSGERVFLHDITKDLLFSESRDVKEMVKDFVDGAVCAHAHGMCQ